MIKLLRGYKYRIYPNKEQQVYLDKTFVCTRVVYNFVYNLMLAERISIYNKYKDNKEELKKQKYPTPAQYKKQYEQNGTVYIENGYIKIPKLKTMIKIKQHREFEGLIKSTTVSQTPSEKYFISILVETEIKELDKLYKKVGVDLGIKDFAITSDQEIFRNPKWLRKSEKRLKNYKKIYQGRQEEVITEIRLERKLLNCTKR